MTADYIHAGVFVPIFNTTENTGKYTFSPLGNSATKLAYWDEEAWVSELTVSSATPQQTVTTNEAQARSASDRAAAAAEKEGLVKPGKEAEVKLKKRKAETSDTSKIKKVGIFAVNKVPCSNRSRLLLPIYNSGAIVMLSFMESSLVRQQRKEDLRGLRMPR